MAKNNEKVKQEIRELSRKTIKLSNEAEIAFKSKQWSKGKKIMDKAIIASEECQKLINKVVLEIE